MPFSAGTFTYTTSGLPVVTGTTISSTVENAKNTETATGLSTCVLKDGTQVITANIPMATFLFTGLGAGTANGHSLRYQQLFTTSAVALLGAMDWVTGANIASAATINLTTATGNAVHVTGTTQITAVTLGTGMWRLVIFDGALTLTHHTTNNNLPGIADITTAANDRALYWSDGTTVYCVLYIPAASAPIGATGAEMEAGTASNRFVTPSIQHRHASAAKAWVHFNSAGTVAASYNITSITDSGVGNWTVNIATDFSSGSFAGVVTAGATNPSTLRGLICNIGSAPAAGTYQILGFDAVDGVTERDPTAPDQIHAVFFGDQ